MRRSRIAILAGFVFGGFFVGLNAQHSIPPQRPIISTKYTADPSPMLHNDTVFLYTGHDEDDEWDLRCLTGSSISTDMVNWTDHDRCQRILHGCLMITGHGLLSVLNVTASSYVLPCTQWYWIGVLVSDLPMVLCWPNWKPLIQNSNHDIDPTVLIDDDGQLICTG